MTYLRFYLAAAAAGTPAARIPRRLAKQGSLPPAEATSRIQRGNCYNEVMDATLLPRYDRTQTYAWNYEHAPAPVDVAVDVDVDVPAVPGPWRFCGLPVDSPLGVPAGPLLNGRWCLYYASLGFDVLTYKTVRSRARECYPLPNLQPVEVPHAMDGSEAQLPASDEMRGSWAVSYGMPSQPPDIWRADVEQTRNALPAGKVLSVSVVGTVQDGWGVEQLADDYAQCAKWAVESGADCVETNFSCPNVSTCDGQLYQQPQDAAIVAARTREAVGPGVPYIVKIGRVEREEEAEALVDALAPHISALAMTNSIATTVKDAAGKRLFNGQPRGICGAAIREASIAQVRLLRRIIERKRLAIELIGVGGARNATHVKQYLSAGAQAVHIATAAMIDPAVGLEIRRELASR